MLVAPARLQLLLAPAAVVGADAEQATVAFDSQVDGHHVALRMTAAGGPKWNALIREAFGNVACAPYREHCRVAFLVDNRVVAAPMLTTGSVPPALYANLSRQEATRRPGWVHASFRPT